MKSYVILLSLIIISLLVGGCFHKPDLEINFVQTEINLPKGSSTYQSLVYKSAVSGAQFVTIRLYANDDRILLSWNEGKSEYQKEITKRVEIGKDYENTLGFLIWNNDDYIPDGEYNITAEIKGESLDFNTDVLNVKIGFE